MFMRVLGSNNVAIQPHAYDVPQSHPIQNATVPGIPYAASGAWKDSICNCCSQVNPSLILSYCCPCIILGQIAQKIQYTSYYYVVWGYITVIILVFIFSIAFNSIFFWLFPGFIISQIAFILRNRLREVLNISGSCCGDCIVSFCCTTLTIAQVRDII
jgi:Cys-rich protein (TIGR01571 family)